MDDTTTLDDDAPETESWEFEIDRSVYTEPIELDDSIFTPVGFVFSAEGMSFSEWARFGFALNGMAAGHQWWLGDWKNAGDAEFGQEIWQVLDEMETSTIDNASYVCRQIPYEERRPTLNFSVHKEAARLPSLPSIRKALRLAAEGHGTDGKVWTRAQMREYVDEFNGTRDKKEKKLRERGETTSVRIEIGFLVAPADEEIGAAIASDAYDKIREDAQRAGLEFLRIDPPERRYNTSDAD